MIRHPPTVIALLAFLLVNALIWIGFAALAAAGAYAGLPADPAVRWLLAGAAFGCGLVLIGLTAALGRRVRIAYYLVTALLVVLAAATFTDDVGWVDMAYFVLVIVPLALLIKDRAWYLKR
jgi:hypothetical protein